MNPIDYLVVSGLTDWRDAMAVNEWVKANCPNSYAIGGGWVFENKEELMLFKLRFNPDWIAGNDKH